MASAKETMSGTLVEDPSTFCTFSIAMSSPGRDKNRRLWLSRHVNLIEGTIASCQGKKEDAVKIHIGNQSAIQLSNNLVFHDRGKHIDERFHLFTSTSTARQLVDILLKALLSEDFNESISSKPSKQASILNFEGATKKIALQQALNYSLYFEEVLKYLLPPYIPGGFLTGPSIHSQMDPTQ